LSEGDLLGFSEFLQGGQGIAVILLAEFEAKFMEQYFLTIYFLFLKMFQSSYYCFTMCNILPIPYYFNKSLAKGLTLLQTLAAMSRPAGITQIAREIGTDKATTTRLCYTLSQLGFIYRDEQKRYRVSPKVLTLGTATVCGMDWLEISRYYLNQLFNKVQKTINLSVLEGNEILYLIRIRKEKYLPFDIQIGTKLPVHCTALGKALMATSAPEITQPVLESLEFQKFTPHTITNPKRFLTELAKIKSNGYAINNEELSILARSVAAPVSGKDGYAVAAINIAAPTTKCTLQEMERVLAPLLIKTANEISDSLRQINAPIFCAASS
jgi:IclR family pca regulon transcriptional regulator